MEYTVNAVVYACPKVKSCAKVKCSNIAEYRQPYKAAEATNGQP
jgi:hypothetical protein